VGTDTGEGPTISFGERKQVLEIAIREARGLPVAATVTSTSTSVSLDLAQHAGRHGAAFLVSSPPTVRDLTPDEMARHFATILQHAHLPLIVVDPMSRLDDQAREKIQGLQNVVMGRPWGSDREAPPHIHKTSQTDEFDCGETHATPIAALFPDRAAKNEADIVTTEAVRWARLLGPPRFLKSLYPLAGIEVGPARNPLRDPAPEQLDGLRQFASMVLPTLD